ncbi:hypothetical protein RclHR1_14820002 [Rhizophagus clarus]|nr:hypothetical protein RclHR1_14820002 [Rhizophagus clarus]
MRGLSNTLENELDFQEFISEYQKVISSEKKMLHTENNIRSSSKEEIKIQTKKKKKSRSIREDDLSKKEKTRSEVIANLINKGTTYDIPPSYPVFDMKLSVFINKNNLTTQTQVNQTSTTSTPIIIQLPSQFYQNPTNIHLELPLNLGKLPSIGEFFHHLDLKYNCDNVYTKFEDAFLEEEITVML